MTEPGFTVTIRNENGVEVGDLSDYTALDLDIRLMAAGDDLGINEVTVPTSHRNLDLALGPLLAGVPAGIVVRRTGSATVLVSGDIEQAIVDDAPDGMTVLSFVSDDSILADEIPYPSPTVDVSTTATSTWPAAYDIRTGRAETVLLAYIANNIGPAAGVSRRRYSWLTVPASLGRGNTGTWQARPPETLLDVARRIAVPEGLAFRLAQLPQGGGVTVEVWTPTTDSEVRLSPEASTVVKLETQFMPREVDEVIVMAGGEKEARVLTRRTSAAYAASRRRRVRVVDQRQTSDLATMRQAADEEMVNGSATAAATFDLVERDGTPLYGVDWQLGDMVTAATWRRATVVAAVQSVQIGHVAGSAPVVTPSIGAARSSPDASQIATVRRIIAPLLRS